MRLWRKVLWALRLRVGYPLMCGGYGAFRFWKRWNVGRNDAGRGGLGGERGEVGRLSGMREFEAACRQWRGDGVQDDAAPCGSSGFASDMPGAGLEVVRLAVGAVLAALLVVGLCFGAICMKRAIEGRGDGVRAAEVAP